MMNDYNDDGWGLVSISKTHLPGGAWVFYCRDDVEERYAAFTSLRHAKRFYHDEFAGQDGWPKRLQKVSETHWHVERPG